MKLIGAVFFVIGTIFLVIGTAIIYVFIVDVSDIQGVELIGPGICTFIGFVFTVIGGGILWKQREERIRSEMLQRTGRKIEAKVTDISMNTRIRVNNRHPYVISCIASVSGKEKEFKSTNVYGSPLLNRGDKIFVFLDFRNYDNYWVEVPEEAIRR